MGEGGWENIPSPRPISLGYEYRLPVVVAYGQLLKVLYLWCRNR
jgi:hypothetical protein